MCMFRRQLKCEEVTPCGGGGGGGGATPQVISHSVHHLAEALSRIEQGIERRFLKPPLGETVRPWKVMEQPGKRWKGIK